MATQYFKDQDTLVIDRKGHQDFASSADRNVAFLTRELLSTAFPEDAIVGEEYAPTPGSSGFTWLIGPIDGSTHFVNGIPVWTVAFAE